MLGVLMMMMTIIIIIIIIIIVIIIGQLRAYAPTSKTISHD